MDGECSLGSSRPLVLVSGAAPLIEITTTLGELVLQFPNDFVLPDDGGFDVTLRRLGDEVETRKRDQQWIRRATPNSSQAGFGPTWRGSRVELGRIATGRYSVTLNAWRMQSQPSAQIPLFTPRQLELEVRRGETTVIEAPGR